MKCDPLIIRTLLLKTANKTGLDLIHKNFAEMSERMNQHLASGPPVPEKFLYEGLYLRANKAIETGEAYIEVRRDDYMNQLAHFSGFKDYQEANLILKKPLHPVLKSCEGTWYYYVHDSTGKDRALRSPVNIWEENNEMMFFLQGKHRKFVGGLRYRVGGLFALLEDTEKEKEIHLVFKVGIYRDPDILRGVFSGFSSEGIPVAGKVILVRQLHQKFEELSIKRFNLNQANENFSNTEIPILRSLGQFKGNYLKVTSLEGFDHME